MNNICYVLKNKIQFHVPPPGDIIIMTKHVPECVRTSDPMISIPAHYLWTTAPASFAMCINNKENF